jgi:hypothetical protein
MRLPVRFAGCVDGFVAGVAIGVVARAGSMLVETFGDCPAPGGREIGALVLPGFSFALLLLTLWR